MKPHIIGEAPSLQGDGTPFSGPSGRRLAWLCGISWEEFREQFELSNLFNTPKPEAWTKRDREEAAEIARRRISEFRALDVEIDVLLAGRKVARAFGLQNLIRFHSLTDGKVRYWAMPHPSGLSHYWNDPENIERASDFLRARVGLPSLDQSMQHIPLDQL